MVDEAAETAVLAAVLTDAEAYYDVAELLDVEDFSSVPHREVWRAVQSCESSGRAVDTVTVADELAKAGALERCGGRERLDALVGVAPRLDNVAHHARIVVERSLARRVAHTSREIAKVALDPCVDGDDALTFAEQSVFDIGRTRSGSTLVALSDAVPATLAELAQARTSALVGLSTGFAELDRLTGGFQGGQLLVLAARPGMGKSAMAMALARNMAATSGRTVAFFSYEMAVHELTTRLLASQLDHDVSRLRLGHVPDEMAPDLVAAAQYLGSLPLLIADHPPATISGLRAECRRLARRGPLGAVVVDYLQLMAGDGRGRDENRTQEVSAISRGLKMLARELDVPVVALSQLNRQLENRPDKRPHLSDLRESGSIEQDADAVMFLYRDAVYHPEVDGSLCELIIGKQRSGPMATVHLEFRGASTSLVDRPKGWVAPARHTMPARGNDPF